MSGVMLTVMLVLFAASIPVAVADGSVDESQRRDALRLPVAHRDLQRVFDLVPQGHPLPLRYNLSGGDSLTHAHEQPRPANRVPPRLLDPPPCHP